MTRGFAVWLGAATVSAVGDGVLYFAIGWTATGIGARLAGLVLTLVVLPRTLLMLVGGALGDRFGLRRTLVACQAVMCTLLCGFLVVTGLDADPVVALVALALGTGVVSAFSLPASGGVPRLFVKGDVLARAMAMTGSLLQVARLLGPPLGGAVVAALALGGAVAADLVTCVLVLVILVAVRPPYEPPPERAPGSTLSRITEGLRAARDVPGVVPLLTAVALVAGGLIPMLSLSVPLAARERGWSAGQTGLVETAWIVGTVTVSLLVARIGTRPRPLRVLVAGPAVAAGGVAVVAAAGTHTVALAGAWVMGVGTAAFTTHVFAAYVLATPDRMLARFQALLGVVQAAPMLIASNVLAFVAARAGATASLLVAAVGCLLASAVLLGSRAVRELRTVEPAGAVERTVSAQPRG